MVLALFTASEFKQFARISVTDYDTSIGSLVTMVSGAVGTYLNRNIELAASDLEEYHSGTGRGSMLRLKRYPVTQAPVIYVDNGRSFAANTLVDSAAYAVDDDAGIVRLLDSGAFWTRGVQNIKVVYRGGYDASTLPAQLKMGAILYAISIWNKAQDLGATNVSLAGYSVALSQRAMPREAEMLLAPFKRPIEYGDVL